MADKAILVRVDPKLWRKFKDLAAECTVNTGKPYTMQSLLVGAIEAMVKAGK